MISKKGFTLIEVLMALVLLALAITAIVAANIAFTQATTQAAQFSTAEYLTEQIRELTAVLPYDDVRAYNGVTFSPPIDSMQRSLTNFSEYSQIIAVQNVSDSNFLRVVADSNFIRVTVGVRYNNTEILNASWIRSDR